MAAFEIIIERSKDKKPKCPIAELIRIATDNCVKLTCKGKFRKNGGCPREKKKTTEFECQALKELKVETRGLVLGLLKKYPLVAK